MRTEGAYGRLRLGKAGRRSSFGSAAVASANAHACIQAHASLPFYAGIPIHIDIHTHMRIVQEIMIGCAAHNYLVKMPVLRYVDEFWMTNDQLIKFPTSGEHNFTTAALQVSGTTSTQPSRHLQFKAYVGFPSNAPTLNPKS